MVRAALYVRVSTAEQAEGYSIDAQLEKLRTYAKQFSYRIYDEYIDAGFQGDTVARPALQQLLQSARSRNFQVVLVFRFDRLFREVRLFLNTEHELREHGIRIVSITEAIEDTHEGRLQLMIKSSFAEYEKAVIRQRANLGRMRAAREGKWMGGPAPFGYDYDPQRSTLVINPKEAAWVRKFYRWFVTDTLTLGKLQQRVNDLKVPPKQDCVARTKKRVNEKTWWSLRTLGRLLRRRMYTGVHLYGCAKPKVANTRAEEQSCVPIRVPRIIGDELFQLADRQLRKNYALAPRRSKRPYLLRGLLRCSDCGRTWRGRCDARGRRELKYYVCNGSGSWMNRQPCERPQVNAENLEPVIWTSMIKLLENPELILSMSRRRLDRDGEIERKRDDRQRLATQIERAEGEEQRLVRAYKEGAIDVATLKIEREETQRRQERLVKLVEALDKELAGWSSKEDQEQAVRRMANEVLARLPKLSYELKCAIVRQLVEKIILRKSEAEIHVVVPNLISANAHASAVSLQDSRGVAGPANEPSKNGLKQPSNASGLVKVTLFAKLSGGRQGTRAA